jgi:hypothetical protein
VGEAGADKYAVIHGFSEGDSIRGGSVSVEAADKYAVTHGFSEGDSIRGGSVSVEAVPAPSEIASMKRNTKSELPGGSGLGDVSLLRLSMTRE